MSYMTNITVIADARCIRRSLGLRGEAVNLFFLQYLSTPWEISGCNCEKVKVELRSPHGSGKA